jgi:hypothetical protein
VFRSFRSRRIWGSGDLAVDGGAGVGLGSAAEVRRPAVPTSFTPFEPLVHRTDDLAVVSSVGGETEPVGHHGKLPQSWARSLPVSVHENMGRGRKLGSITAKIIKLNSCRSLSITHRHSPHHRSALSTSTADLKE